MSIQETKCKDCDKVLYEIEGKFATKKDGTVLGFLQKYEDQQGTITHWDKCEIGKARYEAKRAQEKLDRIKNKTIEQTPAQTKTIEAVDIAKKAVAQNGIIPTTSTTEKTAEQKAQEYMDKYGTDTPQSIRLPEPPKVTELLGFEQLTSQQLQRIENKLDSIISHFKIQYTALQKDTLDNTEVPE